MIITQTPLRISLLGGNTDIPRYYKKWGGAVLTMTIDKYIYCIVKERFDKQIWINYSKKEIVDRVDQIKHDLVREAMKLVGVKEGIEITFLSDIPSEGSGLGSSSAVTVGVLNALHRFKGESASASQLAAEACTIEINKLSKPIGVQDQYAVAYGGFNFMTFGDAITIESAIHYNLVDSLMLFYTGKTRSADKILSKMKLNKRILSKCKRTAYMGVESLLDKKFFGSILNDYWTAKKKLNSLVTSKAIDTMYSKALKAGAYGGKIVGAGGGGFLLLVVPPDKQEDVRRALNCRELAFSLSNTGSKVIFDITK